MAIAIEYNLTGRGWAECIVEIDDRLQAQYYRHLNKFWQRMDAMVIENSG